MDILWATMAEPELHHALSRFVAHAIGGPDRDFGESVSMGVFHGHKLIAAVVFHNWEPRAGVIELSAASVSKLWLTRPVFRQMFGYCFDRAGCQLAVLRVAAGNLPMRRIAKAYGFDEYILPRLRGRDKDEAVLLLTDDKWRNNRFHARVTNGQAKSARTS